jgi:hypothetical protein
MSRSSRTLVALVVAMGLGVPSLADAQGRNPPSGSGSVGTATSSGGSASSGSSGGSSGGSASPASGPSGGGSATPRSTGSSGGSTPSRDRNGRPVQGTATNRPLYNTVTGLPIPAFGPWGRYFPWYNVGFGYDYGFVQFNPYFYNGFYGYGPWNDPFFYDPFNPFGYGYNAFHYGFGSYDYGYVGSTYGSRATHLTGSIRLKVSPGEAKVYVDGVLAGTADQFDGLISDHLVLEGGTHQLELRADGYETYHGTISVEVGKTLTERVSMKKAK